MKKLKFLFLLILGSGAVLGQQNEVDAYFQLAMANNLNLKNTSLQKQLSAITTKIAGLNTFAPRVPVSYQALDNIALQKMYVPGQIFGQQEGTFKELVMGQKYVATFTISPQFDILNFGNQAQKKTAALNEESVALNEKSVQRDIYLQINSAYYNILSFKAQRNVLEENLLVADKIRTIINNRLDEGVARIQEANEAEVNVLTLEDKIYQLDQNIRLQYELLKVLTGVQTLPEVNDKLDIYYTDNLFVRSESSLETGLADIKSRVASQDVFSARRDQWPVLSAVSSFNWQNLSNAFFYGVGGNAIHYSFIGLKLSWDLPTNVQKISNLKNKEIQFKMAENTLKQTAEQQALTNTQREIELNKAKGQWESLRKIERLRKDTFEKNYAQFYEEILALDKLLISQNDLLVSQLNLASGVTNVKYNFEIIRINNLY